MYFTVPHLTIPYRTLQYISHTLQYFRVHCSTQYFTVLYCYIFTLLYITLLHITSLYFTLPYLALHYLTLPRSKCQCVATSNISCDWVLKNMVTIEVHIQGGKVTF